MFEREGRGGSQRNGGATAVRRLCKTAEKLQKVWVLNPLHGKSVSVKTATSPMGAMPLLTITYYTKGTFLLQGNEVSLNSFEEIFSLLKARVENERDETHVNCTDSEEEGPENPSPSSTERQLRESLALLELDFTEFREHTRAKLSNTHNTKIYIQELKDELQLLHH